MAFVPWCEHDVFVSYAHVDDDLLPGTEHGWVTTLVQCVRTRLAQILGRSDSYSLWMDHELSGNVSVTQQLTAAFRGTATLVVVLSPGYTASDWCQRERNGFLSAIKARAGSGVFVVQREPVEESERPSEFKDLAGYPFWVGDWPDKKIRILGSPVPEPTDRDYYSCVDDLCRDLAKELKRQRGLSASAAVPAPSPAGVQTAAAAPAGSAVATGRPVVFLAEATDDLEPQRNGIRRFLSQVSIDVLPTSWYPQEPGAFRQSVERDLARCGLFVQLISEAPGKKPPDLPGGYLRLQLEIAKSMNKPVLQWRRPGMDLTAVEDNEHRQLLESETVRAEGLEEFKSEIRRRATEPPAQPPAPLNAFVFVDMETADRPLAERVCGVLETYGAEYSLPAQSGDPGENRKDLEQNLLNSDVVIVVYGNTTATWVRSQLLAFRKILAGRPAPLRALAVFEGPPEEKAEVDLKLQKMQILNCRQGAMEDQLKRFLDSVRGEVH
jgi:hypothetical protein